MKKLFLLVAMAFITSFASAQISFEQFNQINFKVTPQQMTEQLANYGFVQNNSGLIIGKIDNEDVEISFTLSENGVIDIMNVKELNPLEPSQLNQRIAELKAMILNQDKPIYLTKEQNNEEKFLITLIYR
ncbi:MAG: hypothetical protein UH077_08130 [Bacteroidales bacterium]|nr:hypothetical protein [Bacteroidales bacterium]